MDKLDESLLKRIEPLLGIKFEEWQKNYLLDIPMVLDMQITYRRTGKTTVYIIKLLFADDQPIEAYSARDVSKYLDSNSYGNDSHYVRWFRERLVEIYVKLLSGGISTRPIFLSKEDHHEQSEKMYSQREERIFPHMDY